MAPRQRLVDAAGLAVIVLALVDLLRPSLLLLPTIAAGGDTPCHYPAAAWFYEHLLPDLRLHGWYPGAYLGHPLLLYYFPMPFLVISALTPAVGLPVAFKLGTVLGVFLLPLLVYAAFRLMRLPFPAPLLGAATALVFLFVEDNPIWGGTIASTLTGEFSYTYGVALAVLFLGVLVRARDRGAGPWLPAACLGLIAYAHGYAVLWAGLTATAILVLSPRPWRALAWLLAVASLAFGFAAPLLVPLLVDWRWTTPYDDAWITVSTTGLLPPLLWPLFAAAVVAFAVMAARGRRRPPDPRLLLLGFGALVGTGLAAAGPALGVIDVRFVPFAQLSAALAGAAALGLALSRLVRADAAALGLVLLAVVHSDASSRVLRHWVDWNYSGLEAKELWPAWQELTAALRGGVGEPRVAVEYGAVHERAGSIRMYETLPFFSGRSTLEGVYNQASVMTHPVYYLASELFASSPNPFRSRTYSQFDPDSAIPRLRLFNVGQIVAVSPELESALDARGDVVREARFPPYTLYRLRDPGPGYVEPLAFAPVRAPRMGWSDTAYRWMSRKPPNRALLVFTDDTRFSEVLRDPWAPPPEVPLATGVDVEASLEAEEVHIRTSRPGHPLLVKVSYHPRWRAEGADGPYLASPGLMLIVPRRSEVTLRYAARAWPDVVGWGLGIGTLLLGLASSVRGRQRWSAGDPPPGGAGEKRAVGSRAIRSLPLAVVTLLVATRLWPVAPPPGDEEWLYEQASRTYAEGRWDDAAEYARHGAARFAEDEPRRAELLCVRGEALLRSGHPREAAEAFGEVVRRAPDDPHRPQALFSGALAKEAAGDASGAGLWRRLLREQFPDNPWTERLGSSPD
ncbi:MAG: hypothetical protein LJF15_03595 [Acidobacteria bacterium]|nr:hypothetical protein [Acidobacteriota bacterium]